MRYIFVGHVIKFSFTAPSNLDNLNLIRVKEDRVVWRGSLREGQGPHLNSGRWQGSRCRCRGWIGRSLRILCTEPRSRAAAAPGRSGRSPEGDFSIRIVS